MHRTHAKAEIVQFHSLLVLNAGGGSSGAAAGSLAHARHGSLLHTQQIWCTR